MPAAYQRILLKLSGEQLAGKAGHGIDENVMSDLADEIREIHDLGVQIGIVTGGGNIFRGLAASTRGMDRVGADYMGMLATVILKATKVDGVYTADPMKDPTATLFPTLNYLDILNRGLKVMDSTAISLCMDNRLPLIVFNVGVRGNLLRVVQGEHVGTIVKE